MSNSEILLMQADKFYLVTWDTIDNSIPMSIIKNKLVGKFRKTTSKTTLFFNVVYFMERHINGKVSYECISQKDFSYDFLNLGVENLKIQPIKKKTLSNVSNILPTN